MEVRDLDRLLDDVSFPVDTSELISTTEGQIIEYPNGKEETVATLLERVVSEEYTHRSDAELVIRSALREEAVGRKWYSDRDPPNLVAEQYDPVSF